MLIRYLVPWCILLHGTLALAQAPAAGGGRPADNRPPSPESAAKEPPIDWRVEEAGTLARQTQLTFPERFHKAGESYISPDGRRVIFQAVEKPAGDAAPDEFYAMYVADLVEGPAPGAPPAATQPGDARAWHLEGVRRISPAGSANTCGWFHPTDSNRVLFGSTIGPPTAATPPGYQRGTNRYRWSFPPEMRIVEVALDKADGTAAPLTVLQGDGKAYHAECTYSPDGRWLLFCSLGAEGGAGDGKGDIMVRNMTTGAVTPLVTAPGYDGGPFFSPGGERLCYRSDRKGDNLLQIYVAELDRGPDGLIRGVRREHAVTANADVNWCPYWHPAGRHLAYATSAVSHRNYEIFLVDAAQDDAATPPTSRYGTGQRRVTFADGADVLPAFDSQGRRLIWTSQRGSDRSSQLWMADFVMPLAPQTMEPGGR